MGLLLCFHLPWEYQSRATTSKRTKMRGRYPPKLTILPRAWSESSGTDDLSTARVINYKVLWLGGSCPRCSSRKAREEMLLTDGYLLEEISARRGERISFIRDR